MSVMEDPLGFLASVHLHLEPLLRKYGFVCDSRDKHVVEYQSSAVILRFVHAPLSYELDLVLTHRNEPEKHYSLQDVIDADQDQRAPDQVFFQASTAEGVASCVSSISEILRKTGDAALKGDVATFQRMLQCSRKRNQEYMWKIVDEPLRKEAEIAWKQGDFSKVVHLYESVSGPLTPVESKKLEYASRKSH